MVGRSRTDGETIIILKQRIEALEGLLACYRIQRPPTEKLHKELQRTREAVKELALQIYE